MVAAMAEQATATVVAVETVPGSGNLTCPACGRFLSERRVFVGLPPGMVFTRANCPRCRRWRWFDLATGRAVERPPAG